MPRTKDRSGLESVVGSPALARLLVHFTLHPDSSLHFRALQRHTGLGNRSLQEQLEKLVEWGVVFREEAGVAISYRSNPDSGRWPALRSLVRSFADPAEVLIEALTGVDGIEAAFVFGSSARGEARADSDVDLFVLGDSVQSSELGRATSSAGMVLGRDVDVKRFTRAKLARVLQESTGGFVPAALSGPKRWVIGSENALAVAS